MTLNTYSLLINLVQSGNFRDVASIVALYLRRKICAVTYRSASLQSEVPSGLHLYFEMPDNPLVSIIIPAHNQWRVTFSCLAVLSRCLDSIPCEIILADDASTDDTGRCEAFVTGIKVVRNRENLGFLRTCNKASREAVGTYIVMLNNDTNVQEGWLSALLELVLSDPAVGLVGPKLVYPDGRLQEAGGIVWNDGSAWNYGKWDNPDREQYNCAREADYISGACILLPRCLWEEIGGFDERYVPAYCEDVDLAFEVRKRGYRVVYQPKSRVVHFEGTTCGTDPRAGVKQYQEINRKTFFKKWEPVLLARHFLPGRITSSIREQYRK